MSGFGDFGYLCRNVPSLSICNLFWRQASRFIQHNEAMPQDECSLLHISQTQVADHLSMQLNDLNLLPSDSDPRSASVGVDPKCLSGRLGVDGKLGNLAQIIVSALSVFILIGLIIKTSRREAAVARIEMRHLFISFAFLILFHLLNTGTFLAQGSKSLVWLTAIEMGLVAASFWTIFFNGLLATQVVNDETLASLIPFYGLYFLFGIATFLLSAATAFSKPSVFGPSSNPTDLKSIALFILVIIWPLLCLFTYFVIMFYILAIKLKEKKPLILFPSTLLLFVLSQLAQYLLSLTLCEKSNGKVDASFIATLLETASLFVLYLSWKSITESHWVVPETDNKFS